MLDDPVHTFERVDLLLHRDLVWGPRLEAAADVHVHAFGVLAKDHEIDVFGPAVLQRTQPLVEQPHGPVIHVEIELEARAQQDVARVTHVGDPRIAERADVDGVELIAQHRVAVRREADAGLQEIVRAVRQHLEVEGAAEHAPDRADHLDRFRRDVNANPVAGNHRDAHWIIG